MMIEFLRSLISTQDGKILFILGMIAIAMVFDFASGTWAARINKDIVFESQKGINGIIRKLHSMFLMIFFIPLSVLIPQPVGGVLVYTLYIGYLIMEVKSILENLKKMNIDVSLFDIIFNKAFKEIDKK